MHWSNPLVTNLVLAAAGLLGVFFHSRLKTPSDLERAQLLSHLADEIATAIKAANPGAAWPDIVRLVVQALTGTPSVPTNNATAIANAASAAVTRLQAKLADGAGAK